jgi:hypothetical protein
MAKVHNFLEMWQGSHNLHAKQKESCAANKQMTPGGYTSDTEEIVKASWSNFQNDGAAAFKMFERLPVPTALSAKDLHRGRTRVLNGHQIKRINNHPFESDEDSPPAIISDMKIGLTGMVHWLIQITANTTVRWNMNPT